MTRINVYKKLGTAQRIVNRCDFLTEEWEREHMTNLLLAALQWAERTTEVIDPDAPYAIVKTSKNKMYGN